MKLTAKKREGEGKSALNQIRRAGNIPAVFYAPGQPGQSIEITGSEFEAHLREIKKGTLSTTIFEIELDGKKKKAIVKDIHYDVTSYRIIHLDFEELKDDVPIRVRVPIECVGVGDCAGIKLGGFLRQVIRFVKVKCLPKDLPSQFEIDVQHLSMKQSKRLSDILLPKNVELLARPEEVVVVIAKR